jgi:hypothetical protein
METVGLGKENECPEGISIDSQWLQWAFAGKPPPWDGIIFESVDKECVKP